MSSNSIRTLFILASSFALALLMTACSHLQDEDEDYKAKTFLRDNYIDVYYFWNEEVKSHNLGISPKMYDMNDYFHALLYSKDRWSWMEEKDSYVSSYTGITTGGTYAISITQAIDEFKDYRVWVRYIYPGSPLESYGVTRGAQLTAISGVDIKDGIVTEEQVKAVNNGFKVSPQQFSFRLADGTEKSFTAEWSTSFATDYILRRDVFTNKDFEGLKEPVGYLNFINFSSVHIKDLTEALKWMKSRRVRKLILDLRYNGGGDAKSSDTLVSYIAPLSATGEIYVKRIHNKKMASHNEDFHIARNSDNLGLDALYIIAGNGTASASEMVYNGLKPYYKENIHLVGRATYGKPNGMYVLMYPAGNEDKRRYSNDDYTNLKYVFYPISFFNCNSEGEMIPEEGFSPEKSNPDDIYSDFDCNERDICSCLYHIVHGTYPTIADSKSEMSSRKGVQVPELLPEDITDSRYGTYKAHLFK